MRLFRLLKILQNNRSLIGKSKKCLILDFDNTLWGDIIGEIGWKNIQIGNDSALGKVI